MKKFKLEKFKIAKLDHLHKIVGGTGENGADGTETQPPPPPKCKQTSLVWE